MPSSRDPSTGPDGPAIAAELEDTWGSLTEVLEGCEPQLWDRPTDCPGWTVHDQLAHLIGTESSLLGQAAADAPDGVAPGDGDPGDSEALRPVAPPGHVRNALGELNERWVAALRPMAADEMLARWRAVTAQRLAALRAMGEEDLAAPSATPVGPGTYRDFMLIRIFDSWAHEQDVRRAVGRPGHLAGPAAERSLDQVERAMPYVVGKKAAAPEGCVVSFQVRGPTERRWDVVVEGGRARLAGQAGDPPHLQLAGQAGHGRIEAEFEAFMALACGRWEPGPVLADGRVAVEGDLALSKAVVEQLAFVI